MIEVENLQKRFWIRQHHRGLGGALRNLVTRAGREVWAVNNISFRVAAGEMVGYVGPNGAGKSTTIKMLTGILVPSAGEVRVMGRIPHRARRQNAQRIGVVFGQRSQLWWDLPVIDSFDLHRYVYKVPPDRYRENVALCKALLHMEEFMD